MSRHREHHLNPVPFGTGVLLVPDFVSPREERVVKPPRRKGLRRG